MATDAYTLYKPLRNHLRRTSLLHGLGVVRAYLQHLQFGRPFPHDIEVHSKFLNATTAPDKGVFEWELEILAKEIILNSPAQGETDLRKWNEFAGAINELKTLENAITKRYKAIVKPNILLELSRIAHRQFHWQVRPNNPTLTRYYKIFGRPDMDAILQRELGLTAEKLYRIGLSLLGNYLEFFGMTEPIKTTLPDITDADVARFIDRFGADIDDMRGEIAKAQSYDQDYPYTYSPLKARPLLHVTLNGQRTLIAPVPTYLFRRFTEGVYYELLAQPDFSQSFGESFQAYVGEVMRAVNAAGRLSLLPEQRFRVGKNEKDSVDWIALDATGHLFVECKTKRLTFDAKKALASQSGLEAELGKMASFIVQTYKTLVDAKAGLYPHWKPNGQPVYPIIVTLEDWYAFGNAIMPVIEASVRQGLVAAGVNPAVRAEHPYSICSVQEFEKVIQVLEKVGIGKAMAERFVGERTNWLTSLALDEAFPLESKSCRGLLFPDEAAKIGVG